MSTPPRMERVSAGRLALVLTWTGERIAGLSLEWAGARPDLAGPSSPAGLILAESLAAYVAGELRVWPDLPLAWDGLTHFRRAVLEALGRVPYGQTVSYGQLAARAGRPGSGRAVGGVMARNPWPLVLPCHRVIGSNGALTGFGPGLEMKRFLLDLESAKPA